MIDSLIAKTYYSLFFLIPLIMFPLTSELFEFNKMIFIYLSTTVIVALWVIKMIIQKKIIFRRSLIDIPLFFFLLTQIISTLFSIDRHTSLFGYYGRFNGGLFSVVSYLLLFYGYLSNLDHRHTKKILKISLISSLVVILWGLPGKFGRDLSCLVFVKQLTNSCWTNQFKPSERMFSTLGQPNWLGAYLAINLFISLYFFLKALDNGRFANKNSWFYGFYIFLNFSAILFTRSRSALLSVAIGFFIFFVLIVFKKLLRVKGERSSFFSFKRLFLIVTFLSLPLVFFKTGIKKVDQFLTFPLNAKFSPEKITKNEKAIRPEKKKKRVIVTDSFTIRRIVWKGAIELGKRYPFFGTGPETFAYAYYFVRPQKHNLTSEWDYLYNKAHNEFLNYFATTGFFGLISYLILIGSVSLILIRGVFFKNTKKRDSSPLFTCIFISYLTIQITNFFGFSTTTINLFFYLIPGFAHTFLNPDFNIKSNNKSVDLSTLQKILVGITMLISFYIFIFIVKYFVADIKFAQAKNYQQIDEFQKAAINTNQALNLHYEHVYQDRLSYLLANLAFINHYQKKNKQASEFIKMSKWYNQQSLKASPYNILYWKTKVKNDYIFYQITLRPSYLKEAIESLKKGAKLSPTDPKIPYTLSLFYSLLSDDIKNSDEKKRYISLSLKSINRSIELKPDYRDSYFLKGQLLKKYGRKEEAKRIFKLILNRISPDDKEVEKELIDLSKNL